MLRRERDITNYGDLDILWWDTSTDMTPDRSDKFATLLSDYPNIITNNRLGKKALHLKGPIRML